MILRVGCTAKVFGEMDENKIECECLERGERGWLG